MPWNDDSGPVPRRSEEELLTLTRARSAALESRARRQWGVGIALAIVLLVGVSAALTRTDGDRGTEVHAVSGTTPTSSSAVPTTAGAAADVTTTTPTTVLAVPAPPTTRLPAVASTTTTSGPGAGSTSTSTTTTTRWVYCENSDYLIRVVTDKAVYSVGETVRATIEVTNRSGRECFNRASNQSGAEVLDANGKTLLGIGTHGDCFDEPCGSALAPDSTKTASWCWNQRVDGGFVPAGTYGMKILWSGAEGRTTFQIVGSPATSTSAPGPYSDIQLC